MKTEFSKSLKYYHASTLVSDAQSGVLVAIIALPLSIALGIQSGATLQQGIITAIAAGIFISVFGGTKYQIGGPSASFAALTAAYMVQPGMGYTGVQLAVIGGGIVLILMAKFQMGKYIKFIPYPIVVSFTTSIGIVLIVSQFKDFLGLNFPAGTATDFIQKLIASVRYISTTNIPTLLIGLFSLGILIYLPKLTRKIPAPITAIILSTIVTSIANIFGANIATIGSTFGKVKAQIVPISWQNLKDFNFALIIVPSFAFAFIATIEGLLSAAVADSITNETHDSDQELFGCGLANIASGLLGGLPATGVLARTAANIKNGARTPVSGVVHSLTLLLMFLVLMPLATYIPMTCLAAILLMVSYGMANFPLFFKTAKFTVRDTLLMASTVVLTLLSNLVTGIIGSLILAFVLYFKHIAKPVSVVETESMAGVARFLREEVISCTLKGNLSFASAPRLVATCQKLLKETDLLILDMQDVSGADLSAIEKLIKLERRALLQSKAIFILHEKPSIEKLHNKAKTVILGI